MLGLAALLIFLCVALIGYALVVSARTQAESQQAIRARLSTVARLDQTVEAPPILKDERLSAIPLLNTLLMRIHPVTSLVRAIQQAGLSNRVGEVILYIVLLALVGLLVGLLWMGNVLFAVLFAAAGAGLPIMVVQRKRRRRLNLFAEQLPDALDLTRAALQAGHSFVNSLYVVADEFPDPIAQEFRTVAEEIRLGLPMREALYRLRDRLDDPNVPVLVVGVLIAQEVGGNLAEVVENITHTIRERFKLLRDVQVMTAQGRLSGGVLTMLPVSVGLFMYFLNPTYFGPMTTTQTGLYMLGYCCLSIAVGHFVIQRIVSIKV